jgi:hypothetical protein
MIIENSKIGYLYDKNAEKTGGPVLRHMSVAQLDLGCIRYVLLIVVDGFIA